MVTSSDSGKTWVTASGGIPNNALLYTHKFGIVGKTIIASTNLGAYVTTDFGAHWTTMNAGVVDQYLWPVVPALGYVYSGDTQIIRIPISKVPQGSSEVLADPQHGWDIAAYPNPSTNNINIDYSLESARTITIKIIDCTGRVVIVETQTLSEGNHTYRWVRTSEIVPGMYECLISDGGTTRNVKFVVE
jgi:hypothetical protein